jgi:glycosyltransferase involved in cell wall biosynthesis
MVAHSFYECDNRIRRYAEALVKRGDSVDVLAVGRPGHPRRTTISGVSVFRIRTRKIDEKSNIDYFFKLILFLLYSFCALTWLHILHPYQLIHVHSVPDFEVFASVVAKLTGAKVVLDIHDIVPEFYAAKFSREKKSMLSKALILIEKASCAFSDHVIISNHLWKEKLVARSIRQEKCSVILNYPDPAIFKNHFPRISGETFSISYPGSHSYHQGVDIAIQALAYVNETKIPFHFDIYGSGPDEESLKTLAVSLGLKDLITFHGVISLDEIAGKMAKADLGIVPKRAEGFGNEAFSTKIFEFMALRVPVLISNTKIDQYYFNDSIVMFFESGNVRQLADKIIFLAQNKQVRETLVANSSEFVKQYCWDIKKDEYFQLVDSLTKKR